MSAHARPDEPGISFVDDDDTVAAGGPPPRAEPPTWWPAGGAAALTGLLLVGIAWLAPVELVTAVAAVFPQGDHTVGSVDPTSSNFGPSSYYGVTPGLVPVISFGVRLLLVAVALGLGLVARRSGRSVLSGACTATATISAVLFVACAVLMEVALAGGGAVSIYGTF